MIDGYTAIERTWAAGDTIRLDLMLEPRVIVGDHLQAGKALVAYGPLVLAADEALLDGQFASVADLAWPGVMRRLAVQPLLAGENQDLARAQASAFCASSAVRGDGCGADASRGTGSLRRRRRYGKPL